MGGDANSEGLRASLFLSLLSSPPFSFSSPPPLSLLTDPGSNVQLQWSVVTNLFQVIQTLGRLQFSLVSGCVHYLCQVVVGWWVGYTALSERYDLWTNGVRGGRERGEMENENRVREREEGEGGRVRERERRERDRERD